MGGKPGIIKMDIIKTRPLNEMNLLELFHAYGRIIWAQANCQVNANEQFDTHARAAEAIEAEVQRREDKQRHGAMSAPRPAAGKDSYGEDVYA